MRSRGACLAARYVPIPAGLGDWCVTGSGMCDLFDPRWQGCGFWVGFATWVLLGVGVEDLYGEGC